MSVFSDAPLATAGGVSFLKHISEVLDDLFEEPPKSFCPCGAEREARKRLDSRGNLTVRQQCPVCGSAASQCLPTRRFDMAKLPEFNEASRAAHERGVSAEYERRAADRDARKQSERDAWWARYNAYLRTPEWREKRKLVLIRDGHRCTACSTAEAEEVHHITYRHAFNEPLFDLTAVCSACHYEITRMDREGPIPLR